ncbi:MAG: hypothetical protein FWG35_05405 [Spirochaetaceae bacterium]|nr:hypothetical protein [Spirochaetaceae bacterium]
MRIFLLACAAALLCVPAGAQTILNEEFWADLEPLAPGVQAVSGAGGLFDFPAPHSVSVDTALERILEEARYVFSGMIFGFTFSYTPSDRSRNIPEEFSLEPAFQIPLGDPALFVHQTRREGSRVYARLRYSLREFQETWYTGTLSNMMGSCAGLGEAPIFAGYQEKITAVRNSVKNAVREYARGRIDNKPRRITGVAFLNAAPRLEIVSGAFRAASSVRLKIDDVVTYGAY